MQRFLCKTLSERPRVRQKSSRGPAFLEGLTLTLRIKLSTAAKYISVPAPLAVIRPRRVIRPLLPRKNNIQADIFTARPRTGHIKKYVRPSDHLPPPSSGWMYAASPPYHYDCLYVCDRLFFPLLPPDHRRHGLTIVANSRHRNCMKPTSPAPWVSLSSGLWILRISRLRNGSNKDF